MTQKTIEIFRKRKFFQRTEKDSNTNKTEVYHIDDIWNSNISDLKD